MENFLANIFQKFFHYNTKSESSKSESSEEENTEDSTQDSNHLKPNEEEKETKQFDMDMAVAEEYIEYYADKYKKLIRKHKFAMPLCKHTDKNKLYNAIETTSNISAGYYITAECTQDVEKFAQKLHGNLVTKMVLSMQTKLLLRFSCMILNIFEQIFIIHIFSSND